MRRLFETAARTLRARRELVTAAAVTIVAAILTAGGQGNLAAIVAAGAAGFMAGRACRYRLAAQELRRQVAELGDELSDNEMNITLLNRLVREREEDIAYIEKGVRMILVDGRKTIGEYKEEAEKEATPSRPLFLFSASLKDWSRELDALEANLNSASQELIGEQTQLADLLSPEEIDELYAGENEEVSTNDNTAEE